MRESDSVRSPHIFMGLLAAPDPRVGEWGRRLQADLTKLHTDSQQLHTDQGALAPTLQADRQAVQAAIQNARANNADVTAARQKLQTDATAAQATIAGDVTALVGGAARAPVHIPAAVDEDDLLAVRLDPLDVDERCDHGHASWHGAIGDRLRRPGR